MLNMRVKGITGNKATEDNRGQIWTRDSGPLYSPLPHLVVSIGFSVEGLGFPQIRGPQHEPQNAIILHCRDPQEGTPDFGNPCPAVSLRIGFSCLL